MAQYSFDRRRNNGPEDSLPPVFDEDIIPKFQGKDRKARAALDIRPICQSLVQASFNFLNIIESSKSYSQDLLARRLVQHTLKLNKPKLLVQCEGLYTDMERSLTPKNSISYGPRQSKNTSFHEKGRLNVEVKFAPYSCQKRRSPMHVNFEFFSAIKAFFE